MLEFQFCLWICYDFQAMTRKHKYSVVCLDGASCQSQHESGLGHVENCSCLCLLCLCLSVLGVCAAIGCVTIYVYMRRRDAELHSAHVMVLVIILYVS